MPLLHRGVRREERLHGALDARRHDEERVHALGLAQVLRRHALHGAGDLHERRRQGAGAAGDDRRAPVGRELAVAREREHQEEGQDVDDERDQQHHEDARVVVVVPAAEEEAELEDDRGDRGEEARDGHDQHVAVLHVRELVRHHALELAGRQHRHDPGGRADGRALLRAPAREGVRHVRNPPRRCAAWAGPPGCRAARSSRAAPAPPAARPPWPPSRTARACPRRTAGRSSARR